MPYNVNGISVKTPQELGIDPNDTTKMAAYADFFKHLTGTIYDAQKWNNIGIAAGTAGFGAGIIKGGSGSTGTGTDTGGSDPTSDGSGGDDPTSDNMPDGGSSGGSGIDWGGLIKQYGGDIGKALSAAVSKYGTTALEAWNVYNAAQRQTEADNYATSALNGTPGQPGTGAIAQYAAKQPLRTAGIAGMLNPSANAPDLSSLKTLAGANSGNPFARGGALPVAGQGRPISAGPVNNTPTPSVPAGPMGGQTLFGGTLPVAGSSPASQLQGMANSAAPQQAPTNPTLPVAQTPQTPTLQKPQVPTLPFAPVNRTAGQY